MKPWLACAIVALWTTPVAAQPTTPPCTSPPVTYVDYWCDVIAKVIDARKGAPAGARLAIENAIEVTGGNTRAFLMFAQARSKDLDVARIEDARTDKQVGAPGATAGSTSLVSKGAVPSILGFAVENGALTQSVSGTTATLRGNLVGWLDLVQSQGFIAAYQDDSRLVRQLRRVSYSLTFNTSAPTTAVATSGSGGLSPDAVKDQLRRLNQQLAGYSVRVALVDRRDPREESNRARVASGLDDAMVKVLQSDRAFDTFITSDEYQEKYVVETAKMLSDPDLSDKEVPKVLYRQLEALRLLMISRIDRFDDRVSEVLNALDGFEKKRLQVFEALQKRPLVAFEYVNTRFPDLPDTSTLRVIAEGQMGPRVDLTANVAFTLQGAMTLPGGQSTKSGMRDFQAAAQMEIPLANAQRQLAGARGIGVPVIGLSYLSQKLTTRARTTFAGATFELDPGWVHALQARVTIPVKGSGVKMPLSVTYANRSELIREKTLRGHIGLTFDMDVLASLVK